MTLVSMFNTSVALRNSGLSSIKVFTDIKHIALALKREMAIAALIMVVMGKC